MKVRTRQFLPGLALTALLAVLALAFARLPGVSHLGALSVALLLGLCWRALAGLKLGFHAGIAFSARTLLRLGIVLLGVRLNLDVIVQAGLRILLLDVMVIVVGVAGITWLGRRVGLDPMIACLVAVGSSICGASAVAATAPTIGAREDDVAIVIPLCSLIGTVAMLTFTFLQHRWALAPADYGMMAGATLHEVAQVLAAVAPFPATAEMGVVTKLTRVMLLVPVVFVLGWVFARRRARPAGRRDGPLTQAVIPKPWFVLGFLLVGVVNTVVWRVFPAQQVFLGEINRHVLSGANFFMAMAMAALGLQFDFDRLRATGCRVLAVALAGWVALAGLAAGGIWLLNVWR